MTARDTRKLRKIEMKLRVQPGKCGGRKKSCQILDGIKAPSGYHTEWDHVRRISSKRQANKVSEVLA
jgi:hypothetical protein